VVKGKSRPVAIFEVKTTRGLREGIEAHEGVGDQPEAKEK
jgi:hypothetical protein